jgi:hypothetical protein
MQNYPATIRLNKDSVMPNSINIPLIISAYEFDSTDEDLNTIFSKLDDLLIGIEPNKYIVVKK